jgi:hypothetical protein
MQIMFPKCIDNDNDNDNKNRIYSNTREYIAKYRRLGLIQFLRVGKPQSETTRLRHASLKVALVP